MRRDYPNGFLRALRHAARRSELEAELLDAVDEIERLTQERDQLRSEWRIQNACIADQHDKLAKLKGRLRETAQVLIAEVGADGPTNAEESARKAVSGIERLRNTLRGIELYATDTLSGPVRGPDDRKWYRDGIIEIVKRVRAALAGKEDKP